MLDGRAISTPATSSTIDRYGYMQITDRSKDVIKSGGEWISSIDIENLAVGHPKVAEAAVIGIRHPKWAERPLLIVVPKKEQTVTGDEMLGSCRARSPSGGCRTTSCSSSEIPHTATGKILKTALRDNFKDYVLSTARR